MPEGDNFFPEKTLWKVLEGLFRKKNVPMRKSYTLSITANQKQKSKKKLKVLCFYKKPVNMSQQKKSLTKLGLKIGEFWQLLNLCGLLISGRFFQNYNDSKSIHGLIPLYFASLSCYTYDCGFFETKQRLE